ncbi:hypothetical protein SNE40_012619 [Patella caerulea]|uniref:Uncharacterized protein n=1 Tax=Patella caerulea TaxID=87958 RepID=A0AAN8JPC9_PATCE
MFGIIELRSFGWDYQTLFEFIELVGSSIWDAQTQFEIIWLGSSDSHHLTGIILPGSSDISSDHFVEMVWLRSYYGDGLVANISSDHFAEIVWLRSYYGDGLVAIISCDHLVKIGWLRSYYGDHLVPIILLG